MASAAEQAAVVRRVWGYIMLDNAEAIEYIRAQAGPALTDLENRVQAAEDTLRLYGKRNALTLMTRRVEMLEAELAEIKRRSGDGREGC